MGNYLCTPAKKTPAVVFSCEFSEISQTNFFASYHRATGSLNEKALFAETLNEIGLTNISMVIV